MQRTLHPPKNGDSCLSFNSPVVLFAPLFLQHESGRCGRHSCGNYLLFSYRGYSQLGSSTSHANMRLHLTGYWGRCCRSRSRAPVGREGRDVDYFTGATRCAWDGDKQSEFGGQFTLSFLNDIYQKRKRILSRVCGRSSTPAYTTEPTPSKPSYALKENR